MAKSARRAPRASTLAHLGVLSALVPSAGLAQSTDVVAAQTSAGGGEPKVAEAAAVVPAQSVVRATGYAYGDASTGVPASSRTGAAGILGRRERAGAGGTEAVMSGFETLADGSTRLFVELRKPVAFDVKPGKGSVIYVLRGAHVDRRNHQNPLVTTHFNTPVAIARLSPHGHDLWLMVDLRADVRPVAQMGAGKDGSASFHVDFPKGEYLRSAAAPEPPREDAARTAAPSSAALASSSQPER